MGMERQRGQDPKDLEQTQEAIEEEESQRRKKGVGGQITARKRKATEKPQRLEE